MTSSTAPSGLNRTSPGTAIGELSNLNEFRNGLRGALGDAKGMKRGGCKASRERGSLHARNAYEQAADSILNDLTFSFMAFMSLPAIGWSILSLSIFCMSTIFCMSDFDMVPMTSIL